jgi:hypothetical protein
MNEYAACEQAYKNGFCDGKQNIEICTRVKVAYEQLSKCYTDICRTARDSCSLVYLEEDIRDILNMLLELQVKLGVLKREEDL